MLRTKPALDSWGFKCNGKELWQQALARAKASDAARDVCALELIRHHRNLGCPDDPKVSCPPFFVFQGPMVSIDT